MQKSIIDKRFRQRQMLNICMFRNVACLFCRLVNFRLLKKSGITLDNLMNNLLNKSVPKYARHKILCKSKLGMKIPNFT